MQLASVPKLLTCSVHRFYNPYRLHSSLDYNSSMVFERIHDLKTAHAR